jgi:hypothetical protein
MGRAQFGYSSLVIAVLRSANEFCENMHRAVQCFFAGLTDMPTMIS